MAPQNSEIYGEICRTRDSIVRNPPTALVPPYDRSAGRQNHTAAAIRRRNELREPGSAHLYKTCGDNMLPRALCRSRPGFPRETAGERLERDSQAKRQSRSPRSKVERVELPGDGTGERRHIVPATLHFKRNSLVLLCFWQFFYFIFFGI